LRSSGIWLPVTITAAAPAAIAAMASAGVGTAPQSVTLSPQARAVRATTPAKAGDEARRSRPMNRPVPVGQVAMKAAT
jgi:hypothetical protein